MSEGRTYIIPGSVVSKKNSKIATMVGGKNVPMRAIIIPSKAYQKWEKAVRLLFSKRVVGAVGFPVAVEAHFYYRGTQPDLSGAMESIGDCMEGVLWQDDKLIQSWDGSRLHHDKQNPRTVVIVRPFDGVG